MNFIIRIHAKMERDVNQYEVLIIKKLQLRYDSSMCQTKDTPFCRGKWRYMKKLEHKHQIKSKRWSWTESTVLWVRTLQKVCER